MTAQTQDHRLDSLKDLVDHPPQDEQSRQALLRLCCQAEFAVQTPFQRLWKTFFCVRPLFS